MDVDELLADSELPEVDLDVDGARRSIVARGRSSRRRRRIGAGLAVTLLVAAAVAGVVATRHRSSDVAAGPPSTSVTTSIPTTTAPATSPEPGDPATWTTDPGRLPAADSDSIDVLVTRLGCNDGITGTVLRPGVVADRDRVVITITVEPAAAGGHTCLGGPPVHHVVELGEPLGDRMLVDGGCAQTQAASTSMCRDSDGVRWQMLGTGPAATRAVTGVLHMTGGPGPGIDWPAAGTVRVERHVDGGGGAVVATATTGSDGRFEVHLPPGSYDVYGRTPSYMGGEQDCTADNPIHVGGSDLTGVSVDCPMR